MAVTLSSISLNISTSNTPSWTTLFDLVYPKGAYYLSHESTSPATLFGNTNSQWTSLDSAVVRTSDNTDSAGNDWISHYHWTCGGTYGSESQVYLMNGDNAPFMSSTMSDRWWATFTTPVAKVQGVGRITSTTQEGYSNLPKYQNCYGWYRNS